MDASPLSCGPRASSLRWMTRAAPCCWAAPASRQWCAAAAWRLRRSREPCSWPCVREATRHPHSASERHCEHAVHASHVCAGRRHAGCTLCRPPQRGQPALQRGVLTHGISCLRARWASTANADSPLACHVRRVLPRLAVPGVPCPVSRGSARQGAAVRHELAASPYSCVASHLTLPPNHLLHLRCTGRPGEDAIEVARLVERGLRESRAVDLESLVVLAGGARLGSCWVPAGRPLVGAGWALVPGSVPLAAGG